MTMLTVDDAVGRIDAILHYAQHQGLDIELILARIYADHFTSDESCDSCHMYGVSFGEKLQQLMEERGHDS